MTTKMTSEATSVARRMSWSGTVPAATDESAHQFMIQLNEKAVRMVPPNWFLLAKFISPATSWQPPPKSRQNIAAVFSPAGVSPCPNAMGVSAAHPMARPMSPSDVGSANTSCFGARSTLRIIRFSISPSPSRDP